LSWKPPILWLSRPPPWASLERKQRATCGWFVPHPPTSKKGYKRHSNTPKASDTLQSFSTFLNNICQQIFLYTICQQYLSEILVNNISQRYKWPFSIAWTYIFTTATVSTLHYADGVQNTPITCIICQLRNAPFVKFDMRLLSNLICVICQIRYASFVKFNMCHLSNSLCVIYSKSGFRWFPEIADNLNLLQKECLRMWKLSILQYEFFMNFKFNMLRLQINPTLQCFEWKN